MRDDDRKVLKFACQLMGGVLPIAEKARVDRGNLNRWLAGKPTLSSEKVEAVLKEIGLPNSRPDTKRVIEWRATKDCRKEMAALLPLYFPQGAKVAFAPWTTGVLKDRLAQVVRLRPEIFALSDGRTRAVLRAPAGLFGQLDNALKMGFALAGPTKEESKLSIVDNEARWVKGPLSIPDFDRGWAPGSGQRTLDDLLYTIRKSGLSYGDVEQLVMGRKRH